MMKKFHEILICVIGTTPQIITETIYALATKKDPVFLDEISILTTTLGKKKIEETLINRGILNNLIKDYNLPPLKLTDASFIVFSDQNGNLLDDIVTPEHNECVGDTITSYIKELSNDFSKRLHCSLAGGRKTMSFYLGMALQLFGRSWDELYHVLITPEFELNPEFFYKPPQNKIIESKMPDGSIRTLETKNAQIHLTQLPFIRFRDKIHLEGKSFRELIKEGQKSIDSNVMVLPLKLKLRERSICIGDSLVINNISPIQLVFYTLFLVKKKACGKRKCSPGCDECFITIKEEIPGNSEMVKEIFYYYKLIYPSRADELFDKYKEGFHSETIRSYISKINQKIKKELGNDSLSYHYIINTKRHYGNSKYGIYLDKSKITIMK